MEHATLAKQSERRLPVGRVRSLGERNGVNAAGSLIDKKAPRREKAPKKAGSARSLRKGMARKSKPDKLVCRYCGSDDLAPSFIRRRDRRCRKCFSKRYGAAARTTKARARK